VTSEPACITCGDVAIPMRVVTTGGADGLAHCVTDHGEPSDVDLGLLDDDVKAGDRLLVHACVAIQRLDAPPEDAQGSGVPQGARA
jgi:hydrogenase maturation factor